jgi:hypothetical protein
MSITFSDQITDLRHAVLQARAEVDEALDDLRHHAGRLGVADPLERHLVDLGFALDDLGAAALHLAATAQTHLGDGDADWWLR